MAKGDAKKPGTVSREYTLNLGKLLHGCTFKKKPRAIKKIREFAQKQMNTSDVRVDVKLNKEVWSHGIRNVQKKIRIRVDRKRNDDDDAKEEFYSYVSVADLPAEGYAFLGTKVVE